MKNFIKDLNIHFYLRLLLIAILPVAGAMHIKGSDITDWNTLFDIVKDFISNPYLIGLFIVTLYQTYFQTRISKKETLRKDITYKDFYKKESDKNGKSIK